MKILPYGAQSKIMANFTFIQAGFERFEQEDIMKLTYEPESVYHKSYIEHVVTLQIRYRTEYPSEGSREIWQKHAEEDGASLAQVRLYDAAKGDWCWYDCLVYPHLRNQEGLDFIMIPDENGYSRRVLPTQLRPRDVRESARSLTRRRR